MTFTIVSSIQSQVNGDAYVTPTDFSFADITNDISANSSDASYSNWWYGVTYYGNNSIVMSKTGKYIMVAGGAGSLSLDGNTQVNYTYDLSYSFLSISKDYGATWTNSPVFTYRQKGLPPTAGAYGYVPVGGIAISQDGGYMYAVSTRDDTIRTSTDGGLSWSTFGESSNIINCDVACSSDGKYVFVTGAPVNTSSSRYSCNYGASFTVLSSSNSHPCTCAVVSNDGSTVFVALPSETTNFNDGAGNRTYYNVNSTTMTTTIYKTTNIQTNDVVNASATFTSVLTTSGMVTTLAMSYNGKILIAGTNKSGIIYISNDRGVTWTQKTLNGSGNCYCSMSYSGKQILVTFGSYNTSSYVHYSNNGTASSVSDITFTQINELQNFTGTPTNQWSGSAISGDGSRAMMVAGSPTKYVNSANIRLAYMSDNVS